MILFQRSRRFLSTLSLLERTPSSVIDYDLISQEWNDKITSQLRKVANTVNDNIIEIRSSKSNLVWNKAFKTIQNIANSKKRHMFRPQLVLLGYYGALNSEEFFENQRLITFAAGVEMQHLFMLVHDDMMEKATFRRNMPTLLLTLSTMDEMRQRKDDVSHIATVVGDLLYARSARLLLEGAQQERTVATEAFDIIMDSAEKAGGAQFEELAGYAINDDSGEAITRILKDKTAFSSFVAPLLSGLMLAKSHTDFKPEAFEPMSQACREWGIETGASFHCLSSLANIIHSSIDSGKDRLDELFSGRVSLPLLVLDKNLKAAGKTGVTEVFQKFRTKSSRIEVFELLENYRVVEDCFSMVKNYLDNAKKIEFAISEQPHTATLTLGLNTFSNGLDEYLSKLRAHYVAQSVEDEDLLFNL